MKKDWEVKTLGEVCEMYQPKTISTKEMVENGAYFVFGANGIIGKYDKYNHEESQLLITCRGATCGSVNISEPKSWINGNAMVVRPKDYSIDLKFLEYLFRGGIDLSKAITGAAQPQITRQSLIPIEITFPKSLPEQKRIVSLLDKCSTAIDKAKVNAERNLKNTKELFENYLQGVFGNGKWEKKKLNELAKHSLGKMLDKNKNKGVLKKYLRNLNVRWFGFDLSDMNEMPFLENEKEKYTAIKGDVLICEGGYPGRAAIWEENYPIYFQKAVHRVRFDKHEYNRWFLYYLFILDRTGKLKDHFTGTGIQHFTGQALGKLTIPIPPSNMIKTIINQIDTLRSQTQKLETVYNKKMSDLEELKKSILQEAFRGQI